MRESHGVPARRLRRRRLTAAFLALALAVPIVAGRAAGAQAAEPTTPGTVPPAAADKGGALLTKGYRGDSKSLGQLKLPQGAPKSAPQSADDARRKAKKKAIERQAYSYFDAEQPTAASAERALDIGSVPPAADTNECLSRPGADDPDGYTLNRSLWCQRYRLGNELYYLDPNLSIPVYVGTITMEYTAVVVGSRTDRSARVFYRSTPGSVDYDVSGEHREIAPTMAMTIGVGCADTACSQPTPGVYNTWAGWDTADFWWSWDVTSDETASTRADKVLFHDWYFTFQGSGGGYVFPPGSRTPLRSIRCDSAGYFQQFDNLFPKACINDEVIPHLQYTIGVDSPHSAVAAHIRTAQNEPNSTYPIEFENKSIPGKFTGSEDDPGLHRVDGKSATAKANTDMKDAACGRTAPYNEWTGMPPYNLDPAKPEDCDEYPFASTDEGAWTRNFSVRAVPRTQNQSAGGSLLAYYVSDRILYIQDEFWVEIHDDLSGGGGGGGGGGGEGDAPPQVSAGPDRTGDEGSAISLYGLANDDFDTPAVTWSYTAGPDVDAGTSCVFGNDHSARTSFTCNDNGTFTVTLTASDGVNPEVSDSAMVTVTNAPPTITSLTPANWQVFRVGANVPVNATFTDAANDTHTCAVDWDDNSTTYLSAQNHACAADHVFSQPGMYTLQVSVTDDDGATATAKTMVIVYDPQGGFATAGAYFQSPAGALGSDPSATGRMRLQMNPQYQHDEPGPALSGGRVSLSLDGGALTLDSTRLVWLVVTPDAKVAVKGEATVNGAAGYGFVVYGHDDPAKVRVVVWPLSSGANPGSANLYDNRRGMDYDLDRFDPQPLDGGSLQVHE